MNLEKLIARYKDYRLDILAFNFASYLINWDSDTEAKAGSFDDRSVLESRLTKLELKITRSKGYINTVTELYNNRELLDEDLKIEIKKVYKDLVKSLKVPKEELIAYTKVLSKASQIWSEAKLNNDYASFAPTLKQIVDFNIRYSKYLETDKLKGYDVLLNEFEEGMTKEKYDEFFSLLKQEIVPLVKKINALKIKKPEWANQEFDINKQKEFCDYLMDVMCFDKNYGLMKESEHPFTSGFGTHDVRVTNHYYSNLLISSIFSAIHELGHATYERGNAEKLNFTFLQGGTTMAMHESQSRFYENIVARTKEFWARHYPKLQSLFFDQLKDVTLDDFYHYINFVECSLIRTEADELTYSLHIMVRYEMEKMMIEGHLDVNDYPKMWNKLYKEYLGLDIPNDTLGILQDVHWAGGDFGYFPTYALGSAYGAQLYQQMKKEMDVKEVFNEPNLKKVNDWLKEKVHQYGGLKTPEEILIKATGEKFNPKYYVEYLKNKFSLIYNL